MIRTTTGANSNRVGAARPAVKAAHFDMTVLSAAGIHGTSGDYSHPVNLLIEGLAARNRSTALLDCTSSIQSASPLSRQPDAFARYPAFHKTIVLQAGPQVGEDDGGRSRGDPDRLFYAAAKLLCLDDRLFNLTGGTELAGLSVSTARRARRTTALLCADLRSTFTNRQAIIDSIGGSLDYVVGEPPAVLSLFGLSRVDTLVPRLIQLGIGLVLHRIDYPSILVRPESSAIETGDAPVSREAFWSQFVPSAFDELLMTGSGTD